MMEGRTLKAALSAESQVWIIGRIGDADRCVGFGHHALGGGNVGPALEQFRGHADRNGRRSRRHGLHRNGEIRGALAEEYGDRVLILRPRNCDVGRTCLRASQCRLGFDHRDLVNDARFIERNGQVVGVLVGGNGFVIDLLQSVLAANLEQIFCEARLLGQTLALKIGGADLGGVLGLVYRVANLAPEVGLPGSFERQRVDRTLKLGAGSGARAALKDRGCVQVLRRFAIG